MFFREIYREGMDDFFCTALDFGKEGTITVHNHKTEGRFTFQNGAEFSSMETIFARIDTDVNGFKGLEIQH